MTLQRDLMNFLILDCICFSFFVFFVLDCILELIEFIFRVSINGAFQVHRHL